MRYQPYVTSKWSPVLCSAVGRNSIAAEARFRIGRCYRAVYRCVEANSPARRPGGYETGGAPAFRAGGPSQRVGPLLVYLDQLRHRLGRAAAPTALRGD